MSDLTHVLRPSAIVPDSTAKAVLRELEHRDVSRGGVWSVSAGLWQRYDQAWNGPRGMRGESQLVGTVGIAYGTPTKYDITIYRVTITDAGQRDGWDVDRLCNDALAFGDLRLDECPRADLSANQPDPFKRA
ncbi:MAG: hypothetical protein JWO22_1168 [Frankiales bacterium]|nr:hypothetical protein [Frankiales bacterium]